MANWWDDDNGPFENAVENYLLDNLTDGTDAFDDETVQYLFDTAYFNFDVDANTRDTARDYLSEYLADEYGIDFDDAFDWEAYAAYYDSI